MPATDVGRQSQGRVQGGGHSAHINNLHLFKRFRYTSHQLSNGVETEKPYYCYDAEILIMKGTCQAGPMEKTLAREGLYPVKTRDGRALAAIWINQLKDSVIGPYHEIVFSLDASRRPDARQTVKSPYQALYSFFGGECLNYLHTLYITSPLSIMWGREMQAFPKHPTACEASTRFGRDAIEFDVAWGDKKLLSGQLGNRWSARAFLRQSLSLVKAFGVGPVMRFLTSPVVNMPIVMPAAVKSQYGVQNDHMGHILKGLNPFGIRAWPWLKHDRLELGTGRQAEAADGQESATDLWHEAEFQPRIAVHVPSLQLVVTDEVR